MLNIRDITYQKVFYPRFKIVEEPNLVTPGIIKKQIPRRGIVRHVHAMVPDTNIYCMGDKVVMHPTVAYELRKFCQENSQRLIDNMWADFLKGLV